MIYALFQFEIDVKPIGIFPTAFMIINADVECDPFLRGVKNIHSKIIALRPVVYKFPKIDSRVLTWRYGHLKAILSGSCIFFRKLKPLMALPIEAS